MNTSAPEVLRIDTGDGEIGAIRWRATPGTPVVFAVHGVTGNAWIWSIIARHLRGRVGLVAIDLRGRGLSAETPGPYGVRRHAADLCAVIGKFNASPAVVVGHSLGALVALAAAEDRPADVADVVLVEGGPPSTPLDGADPNSEIDVILSPVINRLRRVWPDRVSYRAAWTELASFSELSNPEVERYVLSDLVESEDGFRSRISEAAVRHDLAEMLTDDDVRTLLDRRTASTTIVRAEHGLMGIPPPLFDESVTNRYHWHDWLTVAGSNHFSVLIGDDGASTVADAIVATVDRLRNRS